MGRRMVSALTLPRCHRLSSSTRCLIGHLGRRCPGAASCSRRRRRRAGQSAGRPGARAARTRGGCRVRLAGFPVVLLAVGLGTDQLVGQSTVDEHHLAVGRRATPWASMSMDSICSQPSGKLGGRGRGGACRGPRQRRHWASGNAFGSSFNGKWGMGGGLVAFSLSMVGAFPQKRLAFWACRCMPDACQTRRGPSAGLPPPREVNI